MTDYKIIADNLNKIAPSLEIPNSLTKDKYPYYLDQPYLNIYGSLPNGGGDDNVKKPLTFKIISDGTINWKEYIDNEEVQKVDEHFKSIEYNKNDAGWVTITDNTELSVVAGDIVQFRGNNNYYYYYDENEYSEYLTNFEESTAVFSIEGNIMSLIDSTGYTTATMLTSAGTFNKLFAGCTGLTSAENLVLPATTLAESCYGGMFNGCTSLTTAPVLPATSLADGCYAGMFFGCTGLTTAPSILPATTLADYCYNSMFYNCSSLTTAPVLPATTLADSCYGGMFSNCTSLNYIKCLATDITATDCTVGWVENVASSGTFVKNPNMSNWTTGINGIPTNWTVQDAT